MNKEKKMKMKKLLFPLFLLALVPLGISAQNVGEGLKYIENEQFNKARAYFKEQLNKDAKNAHVYYYYLGNICLINENKDSARYYFNEGLKLEENSGLNYVGLGTLSFDDNKTEAEKNFNKAIELTKSKNAEVFAEIAAYYLRTEKKEKADEAVALMKKAVGINAKSARLQILLGDVLYFQNPYDASAAMEHFRKAQELDKSLAAPYLRIGKVYVNARNYEEGLKYYKDGLSLDSTYLPLYREMGELYYRAKQYNKAIEAYKTFVSKIDKNDHADFRYAAFLYLNKDYQTAIDLFNNLLERKYENPILYRLLAFAYHESNETDKAIATMEQFWKKADTAQYLALDFENYGKMLLKKDQDSLGIANLRKAIEKDSSKYELHNEIGNAYYLKKQYGEAAVEYELKISKGNATPQDYLNIGKAHYFNKNYAMADSAFAKLTEALPTSPNGYIWRARANANIDPETKQGLAKPYYEKFTEVSESVADKFKKELVEAYSYLGYYYLLQKDKAKADENWKKVLQIEPGNKKATEALKIKN